MALYKLNDDTYINTDHIVSIEVGKKNFRGTTPINVYMVDGRVFHLASSKPAAVLRDLRG